jgi:hypothetical protein
LELAPALHVTAALTRDRIPNWAREGDVHDPARMHVPNFCVAEKEFPVHSFLPLR